MDDTLTSEEYEEGEAWKNRDNTTYNSLLDINWCNGPVLSGKYRSV